MDNTYIKSQVTDGVTVARITREKVGDFEAAPLLNDLSALGDTGKWKLVVDLSEVQMLGSQGLGLFITLRKKAEQGGGKLVLCRMSDEIHEMMRISSLLKLFVIKKDITEAVASLK
jgi:anti-sigma B factor antagonist